MGPRISARDPAQNPAPVTDEIREEINRQKAISREMTAQGERLNAHLQNLRHSLDMSKTVAEQNLLLQQKLQDTNSRVDQLEQTLNEEPKPAPASASANTSKASDGHW